MNKIIEVIMDFFIKVIAISLTVFLFISVIAFFVAWVVGILTLISEGCYFWAVVSGSAFYGFLIAVVGAFTKNE